MKVLVTGSNGQLGREIMPLLHAAGHDASGVDLEHDITSDDVVRDLLHEVQPDAAVNCAAYTRVDDAETHSDAAYRVNAHGAGVLAKACADAGVRLLHVSTDYVFDGLKGAPYDESDAPHPCNVYGASKLAGEERVRELCPNHLIVRTAWLFGQQGPNFVLTVLRRAGEGAPLRIVADQHGCPTWTGHLAPALIPLLAHDVTGVLHLAGSGETTWHGFAEAVVRAAGLEVPVTPIRTDEYPTAARRPPRATMVSSRLHDLGVAALPDWDAGVEAYVRQRV